DVQKYIELFRQNGTVNGINLVSSEAIEQMKTKHITTPNAIGYGCGLIVDTYLGKPVVGHGGGVKGISSYMLATDEMTVTVLTNIAEVAAENIALSVLEAYQPDETETDVPISPRVISLSNDERKEYVGHYETNERQSVDVDVIDDGLRLHLQNNQAMDVKPIGNDQFMLLDGKKVSFLRNKNKSIRGIFRGCDLFKEKEQQMMDIKINEEARTALLKEVQEVSDHYLNLQPADGGWSIKQILEHLYLMEHSV